MQELIKKILLLVLLTLALISNAQIVSEKWGSCFGGTEWDEGNSVIKNDKGYLIYGSTESSDGNIEGHHGLSDAWLIQIDSVGNLLWTKSYGGTKGEYGEEILIADNNQYFLTGLGGSEDGDISYDPYPNSMDYWIVKIDSAGNIIWDKILGGTGIDWMRNAIVTNDGGVLSLGISTSDDGDISNPHGSWDLWMVKLNNNGEKQWDMSLGGIGSEGGASVKQTDEGGFIVVGSTDGRGGGNYDSTCNYHGVGYYDVWVVKLDSSRNIEWQQCYGGTYGDGGLNIIETSSGYIVLGTTMSNDGDVSGLNGPPGPNSEYGGDIWVFKIDKQGNLLWQNCLGGTYNDFARNIFSTSDGGFMIVGSTASDDGDVEGYHGIDTGIYDDVWLAKLDSLGNLTYQYCYGGGGRETIYRGVVQNDDFNYVITLGTDTDPWQCGGQMWPDLRVVELYDSTVGISETLTNSSAFKIYPNPANSTLNVELPQNYNIENTVLEILDVNGRTILQKILTSVCMQLDISKLNSGLYFIKIRNNKTVITKKVIIH
ncbi:MAG: hypothetical protein DRJ05_07885 [Bacteroidetes bacterium]|nr:MAG: hypothetical protein DRJ05_07885 [Bacteroidota bacterium]